MAAKEKFSVDFIGIGAPRCGTTWLAKCLAEHPDVCFSSVKETHFFDRPLELGTDIDTYEQFFSCWRSKKCTGEFTPGYYYDSGIAERIAAQFPGVKILIMLRDPVARAYSNYRYRVARVGSSRSLSDYLREDDVRIIGSGCYARYLIPFLEHFDHERVHVVLLEEAQQDPQRMFNELCEFLEIRTDVIPASLNQKRNASDAISNALPRLNAFIDMRRRMKRTRSGIYVVRVLKKLGVNWLLKSILRLNAQAGRRLGRTSNAEPLTGELQAALRKYYAQDVATLSTYLGRNLSRIWFDAHTR